MVMLRPSRRTLASGEESRFKLSRGFFRFLVLDCSQHRIKQQDRKYDHGALRIPCEHGHCGRPNQDDDQKVL